MFLRPASIRVGNSTGKLIPQRCANGDKDNGYSTTDLPLHAVKFGDIRACPLCDHAGLSRLQTVPKMRSGTLLVCLGPRCGQDACARVREFFRAKNPDAAGLFDEGLSWDGQQGGVNVIIGSIIERSADMALLDEILRLLGEKLFARGVSAWGCLYIICSIVRHAVSIEILQSLLSSRSGG